MPIVVEQTLGVRNAQDRASIATEGEEDTVVLEALRNGVWEAAGRVVITVEHINNGVTRLLAGHTGPDDLYRKDTIKALHRGKHG